MADRKRNPVSTPRRRAPEDVPTAAELPVTRAMLGEVRTELVERIEQSKGELRAEIQQVKGELQAEIQGVRTELGAEIQGVKTELSEVKVAVHRIEAGLHAVQADVARIALLVEEQNARNKVVLDGLVSVMSRQERVEHRMDKVEETVRALAAAQSSG